MHQSPDDFGEFYLATYRRLLRQVFAVTGDLAEAEALQEAFARASLRWATLRGYDNPKAREGH